MPRKKKNTCTDSKDLWKRDFVKTVLKLQCGCTRTIAQMCILKVWDCQKKLKQHGGWKYDFFLWSNTISNFKEEWEMLSRTVVNIPLLQSWHCGKQWKRWNPAVTGNITVSYCLKWYRNGCVGTLTSWMSLCCPSQPQKTAWPRLRPNVSPQPQRTQLLLRTVGGCWSLQKAAERIRGSVMDGGGTNVHWLSVLPYTGGAQGIAAGDC